MLYYGDRTRVVSPRDELARLRERLARRRPSREHHDRLRAILLDAGELAQGIADAVFERAGADDDDPASEASLALAVAAARSLWHSWTGSSGEVPGPAPSAARARLAALELPAAVKVSAPEGFAHYAVYPECYGEAARRIARPRLVVGVRSIGTSLAAIVSAATGAAPFTVRPFGHPFRRRVALEGSVAERARAACASGAAVAVADEGPGLSGSSFLSVARWLEEAGARPEQVVLLPSHDGSLGPAASDEGRARWARAAKRTVSFEEIVLPRLRDWARALVGATATWEDLSAGLWRRRALRDEAPWPPAFVQQERRKYLAHGERRRALLRFAGLGRRGEEALARARALADAGWAPPVLGLAHGFLAQPWVEGRPLADEGQDRAWLAARVAAYLAFRARAFPAALHDGAPPDLLLEMVRVNAREALGPDAADAARRFEECTGEVARLPRVAVDGKLERWEWLVTPAGELAKLDAVDHAHGHDLVGCQPAAWDVAGAAVELALSPEEARDLAGRVARETGAAASPRALQFLEAAYLALRVARWTFARDVAYDAAERARIDRALTRYREALRARLEEQHEPRPPTTAGFGCARR